jgi:hypothetical protein
MFWLAITLLALPDELLLELLLYACYVRLLSCSESCCISFE